MGIIDSDADDGITDWMKYLGLASFINASEASDAQFVIFKYMQFN